METTSARASADMELRSRELKYVWNILSDGMDKLEPCSHFNSTPMSGRWVEWEAHTYGFRGSSSRGNFMRSERELPELICGCRALIIHLFSSQSVGLTSILCLRIRTICISN